MRIGLITGEYPPMQGGVGAFTHELAHALVERPQHQVVFLAVEPHRQVIAVRFQVEQDPRALVKRALDDLEPHRDLARTEVARIAIANPEHAPYGRAAREALESAGIWKAVEPKLVFGENVRQTMQYAETGNADAAITALSLSVRSNGRWTLISEALHKPLDQALAVIKGARRELEARRFAEFINSAQGRSTMRKYGFILPGEAMPD